MFMTCLKLLQARNDVLKLGGIIITKRLQLLEKDVDKFIARLEEDERSENTIQKYKRDLQKLITFLDGRKLSKDLMNEFKEHLTLNHKPSGVNSILAAVKTFLKYNGLERFAVDPLKCQRKIFCSTEEELTQDEYKRLVNAAKYRGQNRLSTIIQTICATGIRVSELKYFTVEAARTGKIEVANKGKTRTIFVPNELKQLLNEYCHANGITRGLIFITETGKCVDRKAIWRDTKKLANEARVIPAKVYPHNLRKVFARVYYDLTHNIQRLADLLGHSSIDTTRMYLLTSGREHEQDMNRMNLVLGSIS